MEKTHSVPSEGGADIVAVQFIDVVLQGTGQFVIDAFCEYLLTFVRPPTFSRKRPGNDQLGGLSVAPRRSSVGK